MLLSKKILAILLFPLYLFAQNDYTFQHLTIDDGLLVNSKAHVFQDAEGFYWFTAANAIQRFDGKNFISYPYNYKTSAIGDWISEPIEDDKKNIWFLNKDGINIFQRNKREITYLSFGKPANIDTHIEKILQDKQKRIWILTDKKVYLYNETSQKPTLYSNIIINTKKGIQDGVYDTKTNSFWLLITGASKEIACFDIDKKQLTYPLNNNIDEMLGHINPVALFHIDNDANLWIGNYLGDLCKYNTTLSQPASYDILHQREKETINSPNSAITDCIDDGNGSVWFGGDYYIGLLKYDKKANNFSHIAYNNGSEYGLHYNEVIYNFYKDNDGNIWVNTDLGWNIFNSATQHFKYLRPLPQSSVTQFSTDVSSIFQSRSGDIWISTWGDGIFRYDSNFIFKRNYVYEKNDPSSFGETLNRAWCFAEDAKGKIWIGCQHGMLSILDTATGKFINKQLPSLGNSTIMKMLKDNTGNMWLGLYSGLLAKIDQQFNTVVFREAFKNPSNITSAVDGMCLDNAGNIWWSPGANGIIKFDVIKNTVTDTLLYPLHIFSPCFVNDSEMIAGTDTQAFFILNIHTKKARFLNNSVITNNVFGGIKAGKAIWIFAGNGILKCDFSTNKISNFTAEDGIRDHELQGAFYKLHNGNIMFSAKSGIIYFNPGDIKEKTAPPNVSITNFIAEGHNYSVDSLLQNHQINLPYNENEITIEYASLSFTGRKSTQYFYTLSGIDKTWVFAGTERSVTYANLAPGKYIFQIKSENADGVETKKITSLNIIIDPPWWKTWWAEILWIMVAAMIIYTIYMYRKRSVDKLSCIRQAIALDLHDDIGSTLNSISVYSEIAGKQMTTNPANAKNLLEKMGVSSRDMIDTMNDIVWAVNPKNDYFENVLQRMQFFAGELLSGKNILLKFEADERIKRVKLSMITRKNLYLIFKEAINNAYKYSFAKTVIVGISEKAGKLIMQVIDDGKGFIIASKNIKGNGLENMNLRAKEINATLYITSKEDKGTVIELVLPIK